MSIGVRNSVSLLPAIQATGLLIVAPAGLSPAEQASLRWTHNPAGRFPAPGSDVPLPNLFLLRAHAAVRSLREELRAQGRRIDAQGERLAAQGKDLGEQLGRLRERMAHLEGLLEGLREAITGKRVA